MTEDGNDVLEYDSTGHFRRFLGTRGQGPGELYTPSAVAVDPTDSTWVSDPQGRVVIFGPDGDPARTILNPRLYQVEGFTDSGLPFAVLSRVHRSIQGMSARRFVQVWTREGKPIAQLGPGHHSSGRQGVIVNDMAPVQAVVLGDTLAVVPVESEAWLTFWTTSRKWVALPSETIASTLGLDDALKTPSDGGPVAVISDGEDGFWVVGRIRVLSKGREDSLIQEARNPRGESASLFRRESASVTNAVYDGVIIHVNGDGRITASARFDPIPRGFANPTEFFTFKEEETGLRI